MIMILGLIIEFASNTGDQSSNLHLNVVNFPTPVLFRHFPALVSNTCCMRNTYGLV